VVFVGAVSLGVLFVFVIPKFSLLFRDVHQALPLLSKLLIDFSEGLTRYGWIGLLLFFAAGVGFAFYIRNPEGRLYWDTVRLRFWVVGDLLRKLEVARFARTLGALLKGGVPLLEALGTVQGVVGNRGRDRKTRKHVEQRCRSFRRRGQADNQTSNGLARTRSYLGNGISDWGCSIIHADGHSQYL
jgi:type II secretory pathway component PulF